MLGAVPAVVCSAGGDVVCVCCGRRASRGWQGVGLGSGGAAGGHTAARLDVLMALAVMQACAPALLLCMMCWACMCGACF